MTEKSPALFQLDANDPEAALAIYDVQIATSLSKAAKSLRTHPKFSHILSHGKFFLPL